MTSPDLNPKDKKTQASEKYSNFLESRKNNGHFIDGIQHIRQKYSIPRDGVGNDTIDGRDYYKYVELTDDTYFEFENDVTKLAENHDMENDWILVRNYVVFNDFLDDEDFESLVQNIDFREMTIGFSEVNTLKKLQHFGETDPIMISISPMASRRDIINHIEKTYSSQIKPLQDIYKSDDPILGKI